MGWEHEHEKIRSAIQKKYAEVSRNARGKFAYLTGHEGALALEYDASALSRIPREIMQSFCGVGNPFKAGPVSKGESLLDVGCGAGIDLILASQYVGETGRICGIDITPEMLRIAEQNIESMGIRNVEVREGSAESIPYEDDTFDIVISNGVLNLSTRKKMAFLEIFRVLGPGGRLQFADIVLEGERARETPCTLEAWSDWIGGAIPVRDLLDLIRETGFEGVEFLGQTTVSTSARTHGAIFRARKPSWSKYQTANKYRMDQIALNGDLRQEMNMVSQ